jgi:hypothetical protein
MKPLKVIFLLVNTTCAILEIDTKNTIEGYIRFLLRLQQDRIVLQDEKCEAGLNLKYGYYLFILEYILVISASF